MSADISEELLQAADQYMLEPLKRLCEAAIAAGLSTDNLASVYDLSENFNAPQLGRHCMLYALEHYEALVRPGAPHTTRQRGHALHCLRLSAPCLVQLSRPFTARMALSCTSPVSCDYPAGHWELA